MSPGLEFARLCVIIAVVGTKDVGVRVYGVGLENMLEIKKASLTGFLNDYR